MGQGEHTVGPIFDLTKLNWLNGEYIRSLAPDELAARIVEHLQFTGKSADVDPAKAELLRRATPLIQERLGVLCRGTAEAGVPVTADANLVVADEIPGAAR